MFNIVFMSFVALISFGAVVWILSEKDIILFALIALLLGTWFYNNMLIYLGFMWILLEMILRFFGSLWGLKRK